jgi:hypothetical protein
MRVLVCRGKAGIALRVHRDPSPRDISGKYVEMVLEYTRPSGKPGDDYQNLQPGECSWNPQGYPGLPPEPGRVYFDLLREAQPWSAAGTRQMDTTIKAGALFPDVISLPRYLGDPAHWWGFFVDDASSYSGSFGPRKEAAQPRYFTVTGPVGGTADIRKELRCRGGPSGLTFTRGASAGTNLLNMSLGYRVSANMPGATGRGLDPGSCAWVDRNGIAPEPGRVDFTTAGNAQLKQIQSGGTVDRTETAAERYPDANTIPVYLGDPNRFWTFTVTSGAPNVARANEAWKIDVTDIVATTRQPSSQPTTVSAPVAGSGRFEPGRRTTTSVPTVFDIRNVQASATMTGATVRFEAAVDSRPTVLLSTTAPTGQPGSYRFAGTPVRMTVGSVSPNAGMMRYAAATTTALARDTRYWFIISANQTSNARANQATGELRTWGQRVSIRFTEITIVNGSDSDARRFGFHFIGCPSDMFKDIRFGGYSESLDWGNGPHRIDTTMTSAAAAPDRFRLLIVGSERTYPTLTVPVYGCSVGGADLQPGTAGERQWNSVARDIDLTKYVGQKGGEQFVWRSKPLRNGSTLMFEVRGYIEVTRQ